MNASNFMSGLVIAVAVMSTFLSCVGCSSAQPASRATSATYDISVKVGIDEKAHATINIPLKIGDGAIASADSTGSTETQTATPTLDIKPDVNLNYAQGGGITNRGKGGTSGAAGLLESLTAEGFSALKSAVANKTTGKITLTKKDGSTVTADCKDGSCTFDDGTTVNASDFDDDSDSDDV